MNDDAIQTEPIARPLPPLHAAARRGDDAEIRRLIAAGHDVNAVVNISDDPDFELHVTPLMVAAGSADGANIEIVRTLLELGADPTLMIDDRSAASLTCQGLGWYYSGGGDANRLRLLLEAGSPLPEHPDDRNRMLCNVAEAGDAERIRVLLAHGVDPRGYFDPEEAREEAAEHRATMLGEGGEMPAESEGCVANLMKSFFDSMASGPNPLLVPVFCAARSGSAECVQVLLSAGADVQLRDASSRSAMFYAASIEVVRLLVSAGLPVDDVDSHGRTPLVAAIREGEAALPRIRALIESGADVKGAHGRGYSVFLSAVGSSARSVEVMRVLVAAGADPHAVSDGYNAFRAAIDVNGPEANSEESVRATFGYLKELGVNINHRTDGGATPLSEAIFSGRGVEVRVLCELGADPNALYPERHCGDEDCAEREVPLLFHAADGLYSHEKTEALLRAGADVLATDPDGYTAISRPLGGLCEDAPNPDAAWDAFAEGIDAVRERLPSTSDYPGRDAYVAAMLPEFRSFVERFAAEIPAGEGDFVTSMRADRIAVIALLAAHEAWSESIV